MYFVLTDTLAVRQSSHYRCPTGTVAEQEGSMRVLLGLVAAGLLTGTTAGRDDKPDLSSKL